MFVAQCPPGSIFCLLPYPGYDIAGAYSDPRTRNFPYAPDSETGIGGSTVPKYHIHLAHMIIHDS